jgi:hypothetical protein
MKYKTNKLTSPLLMEEPTNKKKKVINSISNSKSNKEYKIELLRHNNIIINNTKKSEKSTKIIFNIFLLYQLCNNLD